MPWYCLPLPPLPPPRSVVTKERSHGEAELIGRAGMSNSCSKVIKPLLVKKKHHGGALSGVLGQKTESCKLIRCFGKAGPEQSKEGESLSKGT